MPKGGVTMEDKMNKLIAVVVVGIIHIHKKHFSLNFLLMM
jgi:hypothetical protein